MGIDGAGHAGALEAGQETYGVLGCGIDICYPKENFRLFERMERQGGIITEFLPGTPPYSGNFPMRNRIISGLSDLVIVVEARKRSGSLITVGFALEQGKEVLGRTGTGDGSIKRRVQRADTDRSRRSPDAGRRPGFTGYEK